jgi:hypothetical protein
MKVCRECGTHEDVRRGLCRRCRGKARRHELSLDEEAHGYDGHYGLVAPAAG